MMKAYPIYPTRKEISLDGCWQFAFKTSTDPLDQMDMPEVFPELQMVPGVFDNGCEHPGKRGIGFYRKTFHFPTQKDLLLTIGGLGQAAKLWFDGKAVAETRLPYTTFQVELVPESNRLEHTLVIAVDNRFTPQATPLFSPYFDFYAYGGIFRSVTIQELPETCQLDRVHVHTLKVSEGLVKLTVHTRQHLSQTMEAAIAFDQNEPKPVTLQLTEGVATLELRVPTPTVWSLENPCLHTLRLTLGDDEIIERFGIRTIRTEGTSILLNDRPVRLLGACRHECHKNGGPDVPPQQMLEDLKLLHAMGANFVRCVHYPQDQKFLDLCDEFGILVWQESMGWNNPEEDALNQDFFQLQLEQTRLMVHNSYNHPSIVIWAFLNECCSDTQGGRKLYAAQTRTIKNANPDFLVSYASNKCWANTIQDICLDLCDVVSFNTYPGWIGAGPEWNEIPKDKILPDFTRLAQQIDALPGGHGKPILLSENGCCGIYGQHDNMSAQWSEEFQSEYVETAVKAMLENTRYAGFSIWQFIDSRSYVNAAPGVRYKPLGMNLAGLLDECRRPKLAYRTVQRLFLNYVQNQQL